jgi:hypothetical protein
MFLTLKVRSVDAQVDLDVLLRLGSKAAPVPKFTVTIYGPPTRMLTMMKAVGSGRGLVGGARGR